MKTRLHPFRVTPVAILMLGLLVQGLGCAAHRQQERETLDQEGYEKAIEYYQKEHAARPEDAQVVRDLGFAQLKSGQYLQAERSLRQARMFDWEDGATVLYLAMACEAMERYDDAIAQYRTYTTLQTFTEYQADAERRLRLLVRERDDQWAAQRIAEEDSLGPVPPHSYSVAVFRFALTDPSSHLDGLEDALAAQLSADLTRVRRLDLIERGRLDALLRALPLISSVDSTNAPRLARLAGARYCLSGHLEVLADGRLRVEVQVLEPDSGAATPVRMEASPDDFFAFEKTLVFEILDAMGVVPTDWERGAIAPYPTRSLPAYLSYGQGLAAERGGDDAAALRDYREAQRLDSGFAAAATAVSRAGGAEVPTIAAFIQSVDPPKDFVGPHGSTLDDVVPDRQRNTENETIDDITDRPDDFRVPPQAPIQIPDPPAPPGG